MSKFSLHLWGLDCRPSILSAESVGIWWFLGLGGSKKQVEVLFSNNEDKGNSKVLPLLIDNETGEQIVGFTHIVECLGEVELSLRDRALICYVCERLGLLTEYQLYLEKENYAGFTKNEWSRLLYWPKWNLVPSAKRSLVKERCEGAIGYLVHGDDPDNLKSEVGIPEFEDTAANMTQSKTFKVTNAAKKSQREELKALGYRSQFLQKLAEFLKDWDQLTNESHSKVVDLIFQANLYVQLQLPNGATIRNHIITKLGPDYMSNLKSKINASRHGEHSVDVREVALADRDTIPMQMYNTICNYL